MFLWARVGRKPKYCSEACRTANFRRKNPVRACDICGTEESQNGKAMAVDHCHETGAVRGVLCWHCNTAIGKFNDSPELLARAIHYLTRGADYRDVDREA